jgi:large subunit ribosomal protein L3
VLRASEEDQKRTGYEAVQIGFKRPSPGGLKTDARAFKKAGRPLKHVVEFSAASGDYNPGEIKADIFKEGETVDVVGTSRVRGLPGS